MQVQQKYSRAQNKTASCLFSVVAYQIELRLDYLIRPAKTQFARKVEKKHEVAVVAAFAQNHSPIKT